MIEKYKTLEEFLKYRKSLEDKISELKNLSEDCTVISSSPNENCAEDVIKSYEDSIGLVGLAIETLKRV